LLLQGLSIAGGAMLQIVGLILFFVLGKLFDNTPRKLWTRWNILSGLGWGTVFPIYTNLAVISITYSIISPLILIFAALAFGILYFAYLYNFLYVYSETVDTGGLIFPRAIWQTFTGIYLLEVCMTGLLGIRTATPELVLFAITIPVTAVYQVLLQWKVEKQLQYIDTSVLEEDDVEGGEGHPAVTDDKNRKTFESQLTATNGQDLPKDGESPTNAGGANAGTTNAGTTGTGAGPAPTGAIPGVEGTVGNQAVDAVAGAVASESTQGPRRGAESLKDFYHPAVTAPVPIAWIPQDPLGMSKEEIRDTEAAGDIKITDGGATLDEKNKMAWTEDPPDYEP
jgi:calcium permeable stress-gated cation channel